MDQASAAAPVEYVGFWARFLAFLVDSILASFILAPIVSMFFGGMEIDTETLLNSPDAMMNAMMSTSNMVSWLLFAGAIIAFWVFRSATPGKMVIGAVIVDADTLGKPSVRQLVGRYFAYFLSTFLFGLGFAWIGWDERKQGWHDKLAGTVVIKGKA